MSNDELKPTPDPAKSEAVKPADVREEQIAKAKERLARQSSQGVNANPIVGDETYGALRADNRVVMRHKIALNLDTFRAAADEFSVRPEQEFPPLQPVIAPFMSVIIANHNGQSYLPTVLDALQRQTFRDFEVIVVDDASSDDSVTLVESRYPHVRLIVNRRNQGFVRACNGAADAADGRILVMLNNDTEPEPTWLEELARAFCTHPHAAAVTGKMLLFSERNRIHNAGDQMGADGIPRNRGVWQLDRGQFDVTGEIFSGCGGATAYRRDVWQALGGFDEDFWMYLEDVDLSFRARLAGWTVVYTPQARVYHHLSASGGDVLSSFYVGRNTIATLVKNMPRALLRRNMGAIVKAQAAIAFDALRHIRGKAARRRLAGQLAGALTLPRQLRKRRVIQAYKAVDDEEIARLLV